MQLIRPSIVAAALLFTAQAEQDYVLVQVLKYNEFNERTSVAAPSVLLKKDLGVDYTLSANFVIDAVSGGTPTFYNAVTGASAFSRGTTTPDKVAYGNIQYHELRTAGGASLIQRFDNRDELTYGLNVSIEGSLVSAAQSGGTYQPNQSDYNSYEGSLDYMHWLGEEKNQAVSFGFSYQANEILTSVSGASTTLVSGPSVKVETSNVLTTQASFKQNINTQSYLKAALFYIYEEGYLTNPYLNVVRDYSTSLTITGESRPRLKNAYGAALKYANALTENLTAMTNYRYYLDDWGISSHTADIHLYYQAGPKWLLKTGFRFYTQTQSYFYSNRVDYFTSEPFATSDFRMSAFSDFTYKLGFEYQYSESFAYNLDLNLYTQTTGLTAVYAVTGLKYSF